MAMPAFHHIHCSSRYDRSAASLETDLDVWMANCSLITLTEVTNDNRAATMREKGWAYYNHSIGQDSDNCGIAWRSDTWKRKAGEVRRLSTNTFDRLNGMHNLYIYSCSVVLKRVDTGHVLLVTETHFPSHVEGSGGFKTTEQGWAARKRAYMTALTNWSTHVKALERKYHTDATMIVADWNVNLKADWFRNLLHNHWGPKYKIAWVDMPTAGGSLHGGPSAPAGSPGRGQGDRIIDGTMYRGLRVTGGPDMMHRVASSDHRPYTENFRFATKAENAAEEKDSDKGHGDIKFGHEWWGFGDYMDDELYDLTRATGDVGGEVL